jgi:recombination protein RecA
MARKKVVKNPAELAIANISKRLKIKGDSPLRVIQDVAEFEVETYSFGFPEIDAASKCGGAPVGKLVEIFGPESSGKSLISYKVMADAQAKGGIVCLFDVEQALDPNWIQKQGVSLDPDKFIYCNDSLCAEDILDLVVEVCKEPAISVVVVDSTAALIPRKELEGSVGKDEVALLARAMSKACSKVQHSCEEGDTLCIFINQVRDALNTGGFGNPTTTPGGRALKFHSSMRLSVYPGSKVKVDDEVIARKSYITFVKNKVAQPFGRCEFEIVFDEMALNPIVKMAKAAKLYKIINIYKKEYTIHKDYAGTKKNLQTGAFSFPELAHYLVKNENYLEVVLDALLEELEEEYDEDRLKVIDPVIYKLKEDRGLWLSPLGDDYEISVEEKEVKSSEEIIAEQGNQDLELEDELDLE